MERSDDPDRGPEQGQEPDYDRMTPEERLAMVWTLTVQAWKLEHGDIELPPMRRDLVRMIRTDR